MNLWNLFHPKLSEPAIPVHHNKQALLTLWWALCHDCPENIALILKDENVMKNIAFNYILADHEDGEVVQFNRSMLPAYYGLLRMCCQQSRVRMCSKLILQLYFSPFSPFPGVYPSVGMPPKYPMGFQKHHTLHNPVHSGL